MTGIYLAYGLLLLQIALLVSFLPVNQLFSRKKIDAITLLGPGSWFFLFFLFKFVVPQIFIPLNDWRIFGLGSESRTLVIEVFYSTQVILSLFLLVALTTTHAVSMCARIDKMRFSRSFRLRENNSNTQLMCLAFVAFGLAGALYLLSQDRSGPRGELVSGLQGQIAYAALYFSNVGVASVLVNFLNGTNKYFLFLLGVLAYSIFLSLFGARGIVVAFILVTAVYFLNFRYTKISKSTLLMVATLFLAVIFTLDLVFSLLIYGEIRFGSGSEVSLTSALGYSREFDGFHNLAMIVSQTSYFSGDPSIFLGGRTDELFVLRYFPEVYNRGYGHPATYIGEFLLGVGMVGVLYCGFFVGAVISFLKYFYKKYIHYPADITLYSFSVFYILSINSNFFDNWLKILAAIFPCLLLFFLSRARI